MPIIENGSHFGEQGTKFEWWYFNFISENGTKINVVFHETDIFGLNRKPYYSMSIKDGVTPRYYKNVNLSVTFNEGEFLELDGIVKEDNRKVLFNLDFGQTKLQGEIIKNMSPIAVNQGLLYKEEEKKSFWIVQIPRGFFDLTLIMGSTKEVIKGFAYGDHQWGNVKIQEFVSDWVWGNFSNEHKSVTFFKIKTNKGELIDRYILIDKDIIEVGQDNIYASHLKVLEDKGVDFERDLEVLIELPSNNRFVFTFSPDQIIRNRTNEDIGDYIASYVRYGAFVKESFHAKMNGITEYLHIRKK